MNSIEFVCSRQSGPTLLGRLREQIRYQHHSQRTEQAYVHWVRRFVRWSGGRHPRSMGHADVEAFLSGMVDRDRIAPSTHKQALCALLFLYRNVLKQDLPWMAQVARPAAPRRLPAVLAPDEVARLLLQIAGQAGIVAQLLYGSGMRLAEGLQLRVKDVDFDRRVIILRPCSAHVLKVAGGAVPSPLDALPHKLEPPTQAPPQPVMASPRRTILPGCQPGLKTRRGAGKSSTTVEPSRKRPISSPWPSSMVVSS